MEDYIKRDDVLALAWDGIIISNDYDKKCRELIGEIPAADVVPVVRCRDCKFSVEPCELVKKNGIPGVLKCANKDGICNNRLIAPNDFCAYGQPRA